MYLKENGILIHKIHILGVAQQELKVGRFVCKTAIVQLLFVGYCRKATLKFFLLAITSEELRIDDEGN